MVVGTTVDVVYGQQRAHLPLVVVAGEGPCLMGRDGLQHLRLNWQTICTVLLSPLQEVLEQHAEVFQEELGTLGLQGYHPGGCLDTTKVLQSSYSSYSALCSAS